MPFLVPILAPIGVAASGGALAAGSTGAAIAGGVVAASTAATIGVAAAGASGAFTPDVPEPPGPELASKARDDQIRRAQAAFGYGEASRITDDTLVGTTLARGQTILGPVRPRSLRQGGTPVGG